MHQVSEPYQFIFKSGVPEDLPTLTASVSSFRTISSYKFLSRYFDYSRYLDTCFVDFAKVIYSDIVSIAATVNSILKEMLQF